METMAELMPRIETSQTYERTWTSFESEVGRLILRSRLASSLPVLNPDEFQAAVEAWSQVLRSVPEFELESAYVRSMETRDSGFAIGAPDVVRAYNELCKERSAVPSTHDYTAQVICKRCFGSGMEQYMDEGYLTSRRCNHVHEFTEV